MEIKDKELINAISDPKAMFKKVADVMQTTELPIYNGMRVLESPMMAPDDQMLMVGTERMKKIKRAIAEYEEKLKREGQSSE